MSNHQRLFRVSYLKQKSYWGLFTGDDIFSVLGNIYRRLMNIPAHFALLLSFNAHSLKSTPLLLSFLAKLPWTFWQSWKPPMKTVTSKGYRPCIYANSCPIKVLQTSHGSITLCTLTFFHCLNDFVNKKTCLVVVTNPFKTKHGRARCKMSSIIKI